ncbi:MAG: tetratricopeptide repeat protein [Lentisphaerae bacterium]|jgi:tetratricopeptide (TPR) repeat protein|nr:tetratricopeptide repeat protein [Lentisphaerota bacterium]MBT5610182.1 tetratricopeptide repeat protein [Lentisphaerota bacterium]MBT7057085.1 tetratricopeptide repeat protein [Lentisphaerota bacterium]MBT7846192.1 tetratricopeptide repeat protein [Lentisphaerota bacterium]
MTVKRCVIGILVALSTAGAFTARAADRDYPKAVAEARQAGNLAEVNRLCKEWVGKAPGDEKPYIILGQVYAESGMVDRAVEQFELAAEANPLSPMPRCELGLLFVRQRQPDAARREFELALKINPRHVPSMLGKARIELAKGQPEGALAEARKILASTPESTEAAVFASECLLALGKPEEALGELKTVAGQAVDNADLCYVRAAALDLAGRVDEAQDAWRQFLQLEPEGERARRVEGGFVVLTVRTLGISLSTSVWSITFSPDGRHVALMTHKGIFRSLSAGPGEPKLITPCPKLWKLRTLRWSPDGTTLAYSLYRAKPAKEYQLMLVGAVPGQQPQRVELAEQRMPGGPRWSPSGQQLLYYAATDDVLCIWDRASGEHRIVKLVNEAGQHVYAAQADYTPDGRELVAEAVMRVDGKLRRGCYRATAATGRIVAKLFDQGDERFHSPAVSEDGIAVVGWSEGSKPSGFDVASTRPPSKRVRVLDAGPREPTWHPEGRKLLAPLTIPGVPTLVEISLGGLDRRPLRLSTRRETKTLTVTAASQSEEAQQVSLRWEAFDSESLRLGEPGVSEEIVELKPEERGEWPLELSPEQAKSVQTIKVTVLNQDGVGAVKLIDWTEEGQ